MLYHPFNDKLSGQGAHRQLESLYLQSRKAKDETDHPSDNSRARQGNKEREPQLGSQNPRGISAHGHESSLTQRYLPAVPREEIQTLDRDNSNGNKSNHSQPMASGK